MMNNDNLKDTLDLRRYFRMVRQGRWLYALSFSLALVLALTYALVSSPVYVNHTEIMIEEDNGGGSLSSLLGSNSSMANLFAMSGLGSSTVDDEMLLISSNRNYVEVARLLQLNRMYFEPKGLRKQMLYKNSPILVEAPAAYFDTLSTNLKLVVKLEEQGKISAKLKHGFMSMKTVAEVEHQPMPCTMHTCWGDLLIFASDNYAEGAGQAGREIQVKITSNQKVAYGLIKEITVAPVDKKANAVRLTMKHAEKAYAYDVLAALTASYSSIRNEHKHESSLRQVSFLDERIAGLVSELDTVETNVKRFMSDRGVVDMAGQTQVLLQSTETMKAEILQTETQLHVSQEILNQLESCPDDYPTLVIGTEDQTVAQYNDLVLTRINLQNSAKDGNLALATVETQLKQMRQLIIDNMHQTVAQCRTQLKNMKGYQQQSTDKLAQMPGNGIEFMALERSLELKNSLLLFMLQQRENALMDLKHVTEAGFVYEPPFSDKNKDYSKKLIIAILLFVLALVGSTFVLWCWMKWNDKLIDDSDLPASLRPNGRATANDLRRLIMRDTAISHLFMQPVEGGEALQLQLQTLLQEVNAGYDLTTAADLNALLLTSDLKLDDQHRLVLFVPSGVMKRKAFAQLVKDVDPAHLYVLIGKNHA